MYVVMIVLLISFRGHVCVRVCMYVCSLIYCMMDGELLWTFVNIFFSFGTCSSTKLIKIQMNSFHFKILFHDPHPYGQSGRALKQANAKQCNIAQHMHKHVQCFDTEWWSRIIIANFIGNRCPQSGPPPSVSFYSFDGMISCLFFFFEFYFPHWFLIFGWGHGIL